ncbi:MAG: enoyl-CoA hydratase/isomerase family protein [Armatimonadetes bacterium]|nr:enoyl-CoA hydratase/isomerase family protein [Armatimonadota bacterium]
MKFTINKAAVLGAGVMGAAIAAHLANAGIPTLLLDIVPKELTPEEKAKNLSPDHPLVRNRLSRQACEQLLKAKPAALYLPENIELITPGNLEDDLPKLAEADWIIEAVVERLDIKQALFEKVEKYRRPDAVVSTNTSGIPVNQICAKCSREFKQYFLGTHFFNPPRYMKLLELIPNQETLPEVLAFLKDFAGRVLGKGVVICKDTPNFIANRIGTYGMFATIRAMLDLELTVEEVDALTGSVMGRPKSASFRTLDMVGLDVLLHVAQNLRETLTEPAEKEIFTVPSFLEQMLANKWLGDKTRQGFYKKEKGQEPLVLDYRTMEYRAREKVKFNSLELAKNVEGLPNKLKALAFGEDKGARFAWRILKETLVYAANKLGEIADDIEAVDQAMKWGFNWELGPFEVWDALGVAQVAERLRAEGEAVPPVVEQLLAEGAGSFYQQKDGDRYVYDSVRKTFRPETIPEGVIFLAPLKEKGRVVKTNPGATLLDLGDGVLCLEFHSKANSIGADIVQMLQFAVKEVEKKYEGLVIGNYGRHFSVGANLMLLLMEAEEEEWDELDLMVREFQNANMALKYCLKPVVAAPHGMAVAGGCELCLHCHKMNAYAETYMGLVEVGVGLLPAGGGCKEMVWRAMELTTPPDELRVGGVNTAQPLINRAFQTVAMAKVSTSGPEAIKLGYMRPTDQITMYRERVIGDAKKLVLQMAQNGFRPPRPRKIKVVGSSGYAALELAIASMRWGNHISDHDALIAKKIAYVMCGGDVTPGTEATEQNLLDLEREGFLSLLGEPKTRERIRHMLATGKPLRN